MYVAYFVEVGLLLIVLPWSGFWTHNYFVQIWPLIEPIITNHFVRGAVSGLGFVNLFAGFSELGPVFAARDREDPGGNARQYARTPRNSQPPSRKRFGVPRRSSPDTPASGGGSSQS